MVHGAPGPDAGFKKRIDESAVVVKALLVGGPGAGWLNARPGDGEAIALDVEVRGRCDVLSKEMVLIAGDVAGHASPDFAGCMSKSVPDGFAFAVLIPRALILIG